MLVLALSLTAALRVRAQPVAVPLPDIVLQNDSTDWGARINTADARLAGHPGIIEVDGGGMIDTQVVVSSGHILRFGPGTWRNSNTAETFLLRDNTALEGHGWDTIIQEPPGDAPLSYFIIRPYATHLDGAAQAANISVRNIQFSGAGISKKPNGSQSTVNTGLLNRGTYEHIWFNKTHGIGLGVGEANVHGNSITAYVTVRDCKFTNVGGGIPPDFPGGGGVSLAIVNGQHIVVTRNTFLDALGNTMLDIEPNSREDPITDVVVAGNVFLQDNSTGVYEPYTYGVVTHNEGGPFGPVAIRNNIFRGYPWHAPDGRWFANNAMIVAIYIDYGGAGPEHDVDIEDNDIKWTSQFPIIVDGASYRIRVVNNRAFMPSNNLVVTGHDNVVARNYVATVASQTPYCFGIEERNGDHNTFVNNVTTGAAFQNNKWIIDPNANPNCAGLKPVILVGPHSVSQGNVIISRPVFRLGAGMSH